MTDIREKLQQRIDSKVSQRALNTQLGIENLKRHSFENKISGQTKDNQSVRSGSVEDERLNGGKPTLIPFFYNNKVVSPREAVKLALKSGRIWPSFDTNEEATIVSRHISENLK